MTRAREAARLIGNNTFRLDSNNAVGFNSTSPDAMFDIDGGLSVTGIVTASGGFVGQGGATVTGILTATTFVGALTGAATQVTVADESSDTTCFPLFATAATGNLEPKSGSNLTFNSSSGTLEATNLTLSGDLTVNGTTVTLDTAVQEVDLLNIQANSTLPGLGVTQSGSGDIVRFFDGTTAVFNIDGSGMINIPLDGTGSTGRLRLGAGQDLEIYHDGTNSVIDNNTGDLNITTTGSGDDIYLDAADDLFIRVQGSESAITCTGNGAVQIYHDNSERIATTADGVDISGTGSIKVPVGTTGQRNSSPTAGDFRYNSTEGKFEGYTTEWGEIGGGGGITTTASAPGANTIVYLDLGSAQYHELALSAGITTISCSNGNVGESHVVVINQPSSGIATVGFDTYFEFPSGAAPSMSEGGSAVDMVSFVVKKAAGVGGTELLASAGLNYQ